MVLLIVVRRRKGSNGGDACLKLVMFEGFLSKGCADCAASTGDSTKVRIVEDLCGWNEFPRRDEPTRVSASENGRSLSVLDALAR